MRAEPGQRKTILEKLHALLKDDGAILLDVYSLVGFVERDEASFVERNQLGHFWCEEDYFCFVNTFKYGDDAVILDRYDIFAERSEPETVYNWLQYFSPECVSDELSASGFILRNLYRDVSGKPYDARHSEFAIVATKRR